MELKHQQDARTKAAETLVARKAWTTPQLVTLDAADAEGGANPINPEGVIGTGS